MKIDFEFVVCLSCKTRFLFHFISFSFPFKENMWPRYEICLFQMKPLFLRRNKNASSLFSFYCQCTRFSIIIWDHTWYKTMFIYYRWPTTSATHGWLNYLWSLDKCYSINIFGVRIWCKSLLYHVTSDNVHPFQ